MPAKSPHKIDVRVGKRVRRHRLMIGMSQETLGSRIGITFQQVQKYEKGTNRISVSRITQIAEALDVPVALLFDELDPKPSKHTDRSSEQVADFLATKEGLDLIDAFSQLDDAKLRRNIVTLVQTIVASSRTK